MPEPVYGYLGGVSHIAVGSRNRSRRTVGDGIVSTDGDVIPCGKLSLFPRKVVDEIGHLGFGDGGDVRCAERSTCGDQSLRIVGYLTVGTCGDVRIGGDFLVDVGLEGRIAFASCGGFGGDGIADEFLRGVMGVVGGGLPCGDEIRYSLFAVQCAGQSRYLRLSYGGYVGCGQRCTRGDQSLGIHGDLGECSACYRSIRSDLLVDVGLKGRICGSAGGSFLVDVGLEGVFRSFCS